MVRLGESAGAKFEAGLVVGWALGWPLVVGWMHWPENWAPSGSWHFDLRVR